MSADRLAASNGRPADFLYLASGQQSSPRRVSSLCFYTCATALETQPLPAVSQAHLPTTSTDCPAASNRGGRRFPGPLSGGRSAIALPRSCSSCSPLPNCFATFRARHCPLCRSIDGVPASAGNSVGHRLAIAPPPSHPAGDSTPIMSVKGTYSGEIEKSQSRSGNCDSRPGNAISRELTSLNHTKQSSDT